VRDDADRTDEADPLRRIVEVTEERAALHARDSPVRVDLDTPDAGEVDHDSVVAGRKPGDAVPAAADGDQQVLFAGEPERRDHLVDVGRAHDERRTSVRHSVPHSSRLVVAGIFREDDLAGECREE
jgi:hypothetical protein